MHMLTYIAWLIDSAVVLCVGLPYIDWLIDSAVVLCVGLMKWMGMEGPASLYVCVRARARMYVDVKRHKQLFIVSCHWHSTLSGNKCSF